MTLDLSLVRHGASLPNAERRYPHPHEDAPLSLVGEVQARSLRLPAGALAFSSPSRRALDTARLSGFETSLVTPDLLEADFGALAGHTWAELEAQHGEAPRGWIEALADPGADLGPPGGETGRALHGRVSRWLTTLPEQGPVVAFTHLGPLLAALRLTVGLIAAELPPASVVYLRRDGGHWWLVSLTPGPSPVPALVFVTGGARSGKSGHAERRARELGGEGVTYLATAEGLDDEMRARIERHQRDRPAAWPTVEEPLAVPEVLAAVSTPVALLDCLSLWVSNLMLSGRTDEAVLTRVDELLSAARPLTLIVVSNEVGSGVVPDHPLGRRYRDLLGRANAKVAAAAQEATLLVSGLPIPLKGHP